MKNPRRPGRWSMDDTFLLFPALRGRADAPGAVLSGGEQQMFTICRTLMDNPHLITEIAQRGVAILLVEQKLTIALTISRRVYVMGRGRVVFEGTPQDLRADEALRKEWLEV